MKKMLAGTLIVVAGLFMLSASSIMAQDFCKGDFTFDGDVDAEDVTEFLTYFGRGQYSEPCPPDGPAPVAKTGQTINYIIGDDGYLEKGIPWPNPRFTDNGDGTVTDNLTGLIWLKDADCFGFITWNNALSDCNGLASGSCGLTDGSHSGDWRLPNLRELFSLVDLGNWLPPLPNGHPFINVQDDYPYCSSTTLFPAAGEGIWWVSMHGGYMDCDRWLPIQLYSVWPVRGGH